MGDSELEELRAKRMAQLQSQYQGGGAGGGGAEQQQAAEDKQRQQDDMKHSILTQILTQGARARLNTLSIGKPEKGRMVESMLIQMARSGQLQGKLGETELIGILEKVNEQMQTSKSTTVKFDRRRAALDSSDDEL